MNECKVDCACHEPRDLAAGEFYGAVAATRDVSGFLLSEIHHAERRHLPTHSHQSAYFILLLSGSYSETYGSRSFDYCPLTVWWHKPGIVHRDAIGERGGRFFNVELTRSSFESLTQAEKVRDDFAERGTPLVWLACRLFRELRAWQPYSALAAESLTLEMAALALRQGTIPSAAGSPWLSLVVDRLNAEPAHRHTAVELARLAGVHPVHLAAVFRKAFRQTMGDYLRQIRVRRAADLLRQPDHSLAEIAAIVGFTDQSHFTRNFRSVVGLTPGAFRKVLI